MCRYKLPINKTIWCIYYKSVEIKINQTLGWYNLLTVCLNCFLKTLQQKIFKSSFIKIMMWSSSIFQMSICQKRFLRVKYTALTFGGQINQLYDISCLMVSHWKRNDDKLIKFISSFFLQKYQNPAEFTPWTPPPPPPP